MRILSVKDHPAFRPHRLAIRAECSIVLTASGNYAAIRRALGGKGSAYILKSALSVSAETSWPAPIRVVPPPEGPVLP